MAKVKYVGESFGAVSLTDGVIYECWVDPEDEGLLRVIDDSGEDYLYSAINPRPLDGSSIGGRFEIVEDKDGSVAKLIFTGQEVDEDYKRFGERLITK